MRSVSSEEFRTRLQLFVMKWPGLLPEVGAGCRVTWTWAAKKRNNLRYSNSKIETTISECCRKVNAYAMKSPFMVTVMDTCAEPLQQVFASRCSAQVTCAV